MYKYRVVPISRGGHAVWIPRCLWRSLKIILTCSKCLTLNLHPCHFVEWTVRLFAVWVTLLAEHRPFGMLYCCLKVISEYCLNVLFVWCVINGCDAPLNIEHMNIVWLSCRNYSFFLSERMLLVRMLYGCLIYLFIFVCYVFKYWMNSFSCLNIVLWLLHVLNCANAVQTLPVLRECCVVPTVWTLSKLYWPPLRRRNTALHEFVWYQCVFLLLRCTFWFDMNDSWAAVVAVLIIDAWSISAPFLHYHSIFLFTLTHFPPALSFSRSLSLPSGLNNDSGNNGQKNRTCLFLLPLFHLTFWLSLPRYHFLPHSFSVRAHLFLHAPGLSSISCERAEKRGKRRPAPLSPTV